ncbi:HAD-IA family hydrolase [Betaproteobacteria bacterium]|nr:HAD-IA family hydrolase [Betaproteobacteria bacterium]
MIDLDDTLFFSGGKVMSTINSRMTSFIQNELSIGFEEANRLRVEYWQRYGTTAKGMQERHGVSFQPFLSFSHHLPCFELYIKFNPYVGKVLGSLIGRKYIVTNSPKNYAVGVLKKNGLLRYFDEVFALEGMWINSQLRCKPARLLWQRILDKTGAKKPHHILVDDTLANLRTAKYMGFKTVWMREHFNKGQVHAKQIFIRPRYVDFSVLTIKELIKISRRLC